MSATIDPAELDQIVRDGRDSVFLDVRIPVEFAGIRIAQFRNVPLHQFDPEALAVAGVIAREQPVYLLCKSGGRARQASEKMTRAGFAQNVVVEGGVDAWQEAGLPVIRGRPRGISLERQVRIAAGSLVLLGFLLAWMFHPWFVALSVFVGAGLVFAGITDFCGMGLLLARAPWNQGEAARLPEP